jgi:hypothetical protein
MLHSVRPCLHNEAHGTQGSSVANRMVFSGIAECAMETTMTMDMDPPIRIRLTGTVLYESCESKIRYWIIR